MDRVTHTVLGTPPDGFTGAVLQRPRSVGTAAALYRARLGAIRQVRSPYFSFLDEGDAHTVDYVSTLEDIAVRLECSGLDIGHALETINGMPSVDTCPHHGVVCRTSATPDMPDSGCFHIETMLYGYLSKRGVMRSNRVVYDWHRKPDGAHRWPDTTRAILNAKHWLNGSVGVHFPKDF